MCYCCCYVFGIVLCEQFLRKLPGVNGLIGQILKSEVKGAISTLTGGAASSGDSKEVAVRFPKHGLEHEKILEILADLHGKESHVEEGKAFAYAYTSDADMLAHSEVLSAAYATFAEKSGMGDDSHDKFLHLVYRQFMHTNALNPMMFPSLRNFENEVRTPTHRAFALLAGFRDIDLAFLIVRIRARS